MKLNLKTKCPCCGSKKILTLDFDQLCFECDWMNAVELVENGQFENELIDLESMNAKLQPSHFTLHMQTKFTRVTNSEE